MSIVALKSPATTTLPAPAASARAVDVVLRLRAAVPDSATLARDAWRAALRDEADALLEQLARRLRGAEER